MSISRITLGWITTGVWVVFWGILLVCGWSSAVEMEFNEWGDFFAGAFAPLAFLWLVIGYFQQGEELGLNTKALQQQEVALQLQVEELKQSVEQQKEMVKVVKEQNALELQTFKIEQYRVRKEKLPQFIITSAGQSMPRGDSKTCHINLKNIGQPASNITFSTKPYVKEIDERPPTSHVDTDGVIKVGWNNRNSGEAPTSFLLKLNCTNTVASSYEVVFLLELQKDNRYELKAAL